MSKSVQFGADADIYNAKIDVQLLKKKDEILMFVQ